MERILTGLALPYDAVYEGQTIYRKGTLVRATMPLPLFIGHDFSTQVGEVLDLFEREDGLHYVAKIYITDLPSGEMVEAVLDKLGVSIGGFYDAGSDILFVYELSLTPSPVFRQTTVSIAASADGKHKLMTLQQTKNNSGMATQVKAQDLAALEAVVVELQSQVSELQSKIVSMETEKQALEARVQALEGAIAEIQQSFEQAQSQVEASMKELDSEMAKIIRNELLPLLGNPKTRGI